MKNNKSLSEKFGISDALLASVSSIYSADVERDRKIADKLAEMNIRQLRDLLPAQQKEFFKQLDEASEKLDEASDYCAVHPETGKVEFVSSSKEKRAEFIKSKGNMHKAAQTMAGQKKVGDKFMRESTEQIDEDEEMTQKKKEQVVTVKHKDSGKELHVVKTAVADYQKRGYYPVKEEVESIDELKTGTLMRYVSKSSKDSMKQGIAASRARDAGDDAAAATHSTKRDSREEGQRQAKAKISIAASIKKAVKESIVREDKEIAFSGSHQGKTTLKHIKNPDVVQRMAAHDIKPGIKGYRDRIALLKDAEQRKNLKKEEVEETTEIDEALRGNGSTHEGEFQEKEHGNWFTYKKTDDAWAKQHGLQHEIEVGDHGGVGGLKSTRFGTVKGTVAHIATGEKESGHPEMEKWALKKHNKYDKWGARAEAFEMTEDEVESIDELNKDTLHSYAKKSEKDQDDQFDKIGKGIRDKDPKSANKAGHKFSMRSIGQNRAEKRLAEEDNPKLAKKFSDVFKKMKDPRNVSCKTVGQTSTCEETVDDMFAEAAAKSDLKKKQLTKNNEISSDNTKEISKGEPLSGKKEPIEISPELHKNSR